MVLLERERHLELLDGWLQESTAGAGRVVFIGGEAGVGKTTVVNHLFQRAEPRARILRGACDALSTPRPLGPILDFAAEIGGPLDEALDESPERDRLFQTILDQFRKSPVPTLAVIEDAHWADEATLDVLRFLGRRIEGASAMLVVTYRDDEVHQNHPLRFVLGDLATSAPVRRLAISPLSVQGMQDLIVAYDREPHVDPAVLHRLTGGNPFFASELLADESVVSDVVPATIRDAVLARASRLPPAARHVLDVAAVVGPVVPIPLLTNVAATDSGALEACLSRGMLQASANQSLAFRHELARQAILSSIPSPRRIRLHSRVLSALQSDSVGPENLALLVHHAELAGDDAAVLQFAPEAARQAASLHAHREAATHYTRALRVAHLLPRSEHAALLEHLSYECYLTGLLNDAVEYRRQALAHWHVLGDRYREGDALRWISRFSWFAGRRDEATTAAEQALTVLGALPPGRELGLALSNRSQLHMLAGEGDQAIEYGEQAMALATELGETAILAHALNNIGTVRMQAGFDQGREELERSLDLARAAGLEEHVARAFANLSSAAVHLRDLSRAQTYLDQGIEYCVEHDLDTWRLYLLSWRGRMHLLRGEWTAAADDASAVLAFPNASPINMIGALTVRGLVRARRGDSGAREPLDAALVLALPTGEIQRLHPVRIARAEVAWLAGDTERADEELQAILPMTLQLGSQWELGEVLVWLKRIHQAPVPVDIDMNSLPAPFRDELVDVWPSAADGWEALGCPYDAALALHAGDEQALRHALDISRSLEARPLEAMVLRRLREMGVRSIPRGPRLETRANPANLTARELEIVPFLASGWNNTLIADRLFLSVKTVEHHVGSILAKLGVHSRTDVAAAAQRHGIPCSSS